MKSFSIKNIFKKTQDMRLPTNAAQIAPAHDWMRILCASFILVVLLILLSMYILHEIQNDDIFKNTKKGASGVATINQKSLDEVSTYFEVKKQKTEALIANPVKIEDPSL